MPDRIVYEEVSGIEREDAVVELDGKWFSGCTFTGCTLVFRGIQPFGYADTRFVRCTMRFDDHARMVLDLVSRLIPEAITAETLADNLRTLATGGLTIH